jgi:archaemetzincin
MTPSPEGDVGEIQLLPIGALPRGTIEGRAARLSRLVSVACRPRAGSTAPPPVFDGRDQVDADGLLAALEADAAPGAALVGLTALDMGIPIFTFVFGQARVGGRAAVVSLARLDPTYYGLPASREALLSRAAAEVLHELGHVAGLVHCREPRCLMNFAANVEKADARGIAFCRTCVGRVPAWLKPSHEPFPAS